MFLTEAMSTIAMSSASPELKDHLISHLVRIEDHLDVMRTFSEWSKDAR
jgi:hypothetical protein